MIFDVFISHAGEDKKEVALPLAQILKELGLKVWIDEFELRVGDSLVRSIDRGLSEARFGVVILSPNFFKKQWPQRELEALVAREAGNNEKIILPIWHQVTAAEVLQFSPLLADRLAISTDKGIRFVARMIAEAVLFKFQSENQNFNSRLKSTAERLKNLLGEKDIEGHQVREEQKTSEVFISHCRNKAARELVSGFIEKIAARPIVFPDEPGVVRTVISTFESYPNIAFAVALLTPDDFMNAEYTSDRPKYHPRLGFIIEVVYMLTKLGRGRVCILYEGALEIPSETLGVVYIQLDSTSGWMISLARELKYTGVKVDLNKLLD